MAPKKTGSRKKKLAGPSRFARKLQAKKRQQSFDFSREFDLAARQFRHGRMQEAADTYRRILSVNPEEPQALYGLGITLPHLGQPDNGIELLKKSLAIDPQYAAAYNALGVLLIDKRAYEDAATAFRKALKIQPDHAMACNNLGNALSARGQFAQAVPMYRKALKIKPDYAEAYNNLGTACVELGRYREAERQYTKALELNPSYADVYQGLGRLFKIQGQTERARECLRKALAIAPDCTPAYLSLTGTEKYMPGDPRLAEMARLYEQPSLADDRKMFLAFALGKAYGDTGEYDKSFSCLRKGNRLKRATYAYSPEEEALRFKAIKNSFGTGEAARTIRGAPTDATPIFILGMPRSGTSLVEQILASHPDIHGAGERTDFRQIIQSETGTRTPHQAMEQLQRGGDRRVARIGREYLARLRALAPEARFITDKMPHNFLFIGAIRLALPGARIIHCRRDPMDTCFSIYKNLFSGRHDYAYDLAELGQYYLLYLDLMEHWQTVLPGVVYNLDYEKLVRDQEGETRKLLHHCGLEWHDNCLEFHKTRRNVSTLSSEQVRRPIYRDSVQRWKRYDDYLQPLLRIISETKTV